MSHNSLPGPEHFPAGQAWVTVAGGNLTLLNWQVRNATRSEAIFLAATVPPKPAPLIVEQAADLVADDIITLTMKDGELCINAIAAAAYALAKLGCGLELTITVPPLAFPITASIAAASAAHQPVSLTLPRAVLIGVSAFAGFPCVDLVGISHILIESSLEAELVKCAGIAMLCRRLMCERSIPACGLIIYRNGPHGVAITPHVLVRSSPAPKPETACGSASLAVAAYTGANTVIQPTGLAVSVTYGSTIVYRTACNLEHFIFLNS